MINFLEKYEKDPKKFPVDGEGHVIMHYGVSSLTGDDGSKIDFLICASEAKFFEKCIEGGSSPTEAFTPEKAGQNFHLMFGEYVPNCLSKLTSEEHLKTIHQIKQAVNSDHEYALFQYLSENMFIDFSVVDLQVCGISKSANQNCEKYAVALLVQLPSKIDVSDFEFGNGQFLFNCYPRYKNLDGTSNLLNRSGVFSMTHFEATLEEAENWGEKLDVASVLEVAKSAP